MARVLFICEGNVGRSAMAEMMFGQVTAGRHEARSAGITPASRPSDLVAEVMREVGIDIAGRQPRALSAEDVEWADRIVITGCMKETPDFAPKPVDTWDLPRIKGEPVTVIREARDEIRSRIEALESDL